MSLTVKDLREALVDLPDDMPVVLAKDAEGNGYSPLDVIQESMYAADTTWSGQCYPTPEQLVDLIAGGGGYTEEDGAPEGAVRVLELGPVN